MKKKLSKKDKQILLIAILVPFSFLLPSIIGHGFNSLRDILNYGFPVVYNVFSKVKIKESGFFKYITIAETYTGKAYKNDPVIIVGFTDLGLQQEYLHIPKKIKDHPVTNIGYFRGGFLSHAYKYPVEVTGNIKKIYVYDNIKDIYSFKGLNTEYYQCSYNDNTFIQNEILKDSYSGFKHHYVYKDIYNKTNDWPDNYSAGNVVFMNNYPNEIKDSYYSLDNVKDDEKINMPPNPTLENYIFKGWYTEQECINEWDFSMIPSMSQDEEFKLYASWHEK